MKISIFGDICPTNDTIKAFNKGDCKTVFGDALTEIENSDIVIGNLECAVTDSPTPIKKAGPVLYTNTKSIQTLNGFDVLSLANNHIRDCGDEGVLTAIGTCKKLGIRTLGAGKDINAAREPLVIEKCGIKVGVMSYAEQEFNIASETRSGACFFDLYEDFDRIYEFRKIVDYLIIIYHGGIEYFPFASPELSRKCRKMVECGADLVTCQHSHCIGTIEKYKNGTIVYGQGNSVFGYRKDNTSWNRGLLLQIELILNNNVTKVEIIDAIFSYRPMVATPNGLRWMENDVAKLLDEELQIRANTSAEVIMNEWDNFCENLGKIHLPLLIGWPRILIAINRRINNGLIKILYGRFSQNKTHNLIRCESHREVIQYLLSKKNFY